MKTQILLLDVYKPPPHPSLSFFMEKDLKSKCLKIFSEPKTPKGSCIKGVRKASMKEEGMDLHTSVPETRTNFCSFATRFRNIGLKVNDFSKELASSKTAAPLL